MPRRQLNIRRQKQHAKAGSLRRVLWDDNPHCFWCGKLLAWEEATLEHLVRRADGGWTNAENCTIACAPCNNHRGDSRNPEEVVARAKRAIEARGARQVELAAAEADRRKPKPPPPDPRVDQLRREFSAGIRALEVERRRFLLLGHDVRPPWAKHATETAGLEPAPRERGPV